MPPDTTTRRKPARHATAEARLRSMGPRLRDDNPIVPLMLEMFDAARRDVAINPRSPLAALYESEVRGRMPRATLERMHANLRRLPTDLRARVVPTDGGAAIDMVDLDAARSRLDTRIARGVAEALMRPRLRLPTGTTRKLVKLDGRLRKSTVGMPALDDLDPSVWQQVFNPNVLKHIIIAAPTTPVLDSIMPKAPSGFVPGQMLTLRLRYPDWANATFQVVLSWGDDIDGKSSAQDYATLEPKVLGSAKPGDTRLQVKLPDSLAVTSWVRVVVSHAGATEDTNRMRIDRFTVPATATVLASPELTAILPGNGQLPGREVIVEGRNLGNAQVMQAGTDVFGKPATTAASIKRGASIRLLSPAGPTHDLTLPLTILKPSPVGGIGQARFTLPVDLTPADYWMQLVSTMAGPGVELSPPVYDNGPESNAMGFNVRAHQFAVRWDTLRCKDESDPEVWGSDELVTQWTVVADDAAWSKGTGEYTEFDDGDTGQLVGADANAFPVGGGFGAVRIALGLRAEMYESDDGDVKAWQKAMQITGKVASAIGELLLKLGQPKLAAIAAVVVVISEAVSLFAGLFEGPDPLGSQELVWSAQQLQTLTDNATRSFADTLHYDNSDDEGSYSLSYTVTRLE